MTDDDDDETMMDDDEVQFLNKLSTTNRKLCPHLLKEVTVSPCSSVWFSSQYLTIVTVVT